MTQQSVSTGMKCPECGEGNLLFVTRTEVFDFDMGDGIVKVTAQDVPVKKCDRCGEEYSGPAAAKVRHEAICRVVGLLTPTAIKALREQFCWSQQDLAELTDFGIATVSRWERGRLLQNRSANKVLLALRDCPPFREYLEGLRAARPNGQPATAPAPSDRLERTRSAVTKIDRAFEEAREELDSLKRQLAG